jgi:MerR family transcriptional regulator, copper efflux regulator
MRRSLSRRIGPNQAFREISKDFFELAREACLLVAVKLEVYIMNISAAALAAGLLVKTVRYYADIALVEAPSRTNAGYRTYTDAAVRKLIFIRRAREFGFSIEECRELLGLYQDKGRSSAEVKRIATKRLKEIEIK